MDIKSSYLLVEWVEEGKFSVLHRSKIVLHADRDKSDEELIGTTILITWNKSKAYNAAVLQCGRYKNQLKY